MKYLENKLWLSWNFKRSVSSSIPYTCSLLVGLCLSPFSWPMEMATTKANQETTRARHAEGVVAQWCNPLTLQPE